MTVIYTHIIFALSAILLGLVVLVSPKGNYKHKSLGWVWVICLMVVSLSAVFIQEIKPGQFSPIHLLIPFTVVSLVYAIWSIRKFKLTGRAGYKIAHIASMVAVYIGGLLVAGAFALMPRRFLHQVLFQ